LDDRKLLLDLGAILALGLDNCRLYEAERQRAQKMQALARLKGDFLMTASHELRTPLTSIRTAGEMLLEEEERQDHGGPRTRLARSIVKGASRLTALVTDMVDVSRQGDPVALLDREPIGVGDVVSNAVAQVQPLVESKGQTLDVDLPSGGRPQVLVDRRRFEQVLVNLLSNAHRYTSSGERIALDVQEKGEEVIISVCDSGPGIPEEEREVIFEPFYRGPRGGLGLGLAIARSLAELHGGSLWLEESSAQGSTFRIAIPLLLHLLLSDYRNFHRLELSLPTGPSLFLGDNAQGKTNLLEAVYLLATMRHARASSEAQLIRWQILSASSGQAPAEPSAAARIVGQAESQVGPVKVEVAIALRPGSGSTLASKVVRVNGLSRRLAEAVGQMAAVLFSADDLDLVRGPPSLRRRYLDLTVAQVDRAYIGARQRYDKVLIQRNHLLRRLREGLARPQELDFWNQGLVRDGAYIFWARTRALTVLADLAASIYLDLAPGEELGLAYQPALSARLAPRLGEGEAPSLGEAEPPAIAQVFAEAQRRSLEQEVAAGMTLLGPHRDDVAFNLGGRVAAGFASRAQQRTIALALRMAEARYVALRRGEPPILLLDDVLSEMDSRRRRRVLNAIADYEQVLITATDTDGFPRPFLARAALYRVDQGTVAAADPISG
jgi:DNA replication and repair protein RecF